jgi:hypothetical protein
MHESIVHMPESIYNYRYSDIVRIALSILALKTWPINLTH